LPDAGVGDLVELVTGEGGCEAVGAVGETVVGVVEVDDGAPVVGTVVAGAELEGATVGPSVATDGEEVVPDGTGEEVGAVVTGMTTGAAVGETPGEVEHSGLSKAQTTPVFEHCGTLKQVSLEAKPVLPVRSTFVAPAEIKAPTSALGKVAPARPLACKLTVRIVCPLVLHVTRTGALVG